MHGLFVIGEAAEVNWEFLVTFSYFWLLLVFLCVARYNPFAGD
jgi:hypothetical protein